MWFDKYFEGHPRIRRYVTYLYIIDIFLVVLLFCIIVFHTFKSAKTLSILGLIGAIIMFFNTIDFEKVLAHLIHIQFSEIKILKKLLIFIIDKVWFKRLFRMVGFFIIISVLICYITCYIF